jgi:hypothetical protein
MGTQSIAPNARNVTSPELVDGGLGEAASGVHA